VQLFRVPVELGRLSTGGKPDGAALVVELASLAEQGVTVLVSALPDDEVAERGLARKVLRRRNSDCASWPYPSSTGACRPQPP